MSKLVLGPKRTCSSILLNFNSKLVRKRGPSSHRSIEFLALKMRADVSLSTGDDHSRWTFHGEMASVTAVMQRGCRECADYCCWLESLRFRETDLPIAIHAAGIVSSVVLAWPGPR